MGSLKCGRFLDIRLEFRIGLELNQDGRQERAELKALSVMERGRPSYTNKNLDSAPHMP